MRLEELPKIYGPETLSSMDRAVEQAWRELKRRGDVLDASAARSRILQDAMLVRQKEEKQQWRIKF